MVGSLLLINVVVKLTAKPVGWDCPSCRSENQSRHSFSLEIGAVFCAQIKSRTELLCVELLSI